MSDDEVGSYAVVEIDNLTVYRGNQVAVDRVSFQLFSGTNTAIIGPNGAGKTTLIKAILGLIPAESGQIRIFGRPLNQLGKRWEKVGYIPQKFSFDRYFPLTVEELVSLALPNSGFWRLATPVTLPRQSRDRKILAQKALVQVNLESQSSQRIGTLSGGELKRVLLAYCLAVPRQLIVLDEALAEVDATGEVEFANLLNQLQREQGFAILQISHDLDLVSQYCDRVLCLNRKIICQGSPRETLSTDNLKSIYGSNQVRYLHSH
ncbi:MAG: metal ABC transporter ATP-binding protein [Cyanobacteriota bacterium]|nr:metal ABC transporter ATP-binding protein [Cyanobacteriota bacterium]